ncbi:MAG: TonB-dependent receptor [Proteobacteria bacterium]|nr:TonB-dependent receptor [Pseudomonadota bacterium]
MDQLLSYGAFDFFQSKTAVNTGELGDSGLRAQFTYLQKRRDGYADNLLVPDKLDPGAYNVDAIRASVAYDRSGPLRLDYVFDYNHRKSVATAYQLASARPDILDYINASSALGSATPQIARDRLGSLSLDDDGPISDKVQGHALTAELDLASNLTLRSITSYRKWDNSVINDLDGNANLVGFVVDPILFAGGPFTPLGVQPISLFHLTFERRQHQWTQELNLLGDIGERTKFVLGAFYFDEVAHEENPTFLTFILPSAAPIAVTPTVSVNSFGVNIASNMIYRYQSRSKAAFGQIATEVADRLSLTGGLRYTHDEKSLRQTTPFSRDLNREFNKLNWAVTLDYRLNDTAMTYARVATGYKAGGFNARSANNGFEPENLTSYELGIKSEFFDHRLRLNAALFHAAHKDVQVGQFLAGSGGSLGTTVNAGKAEYWGVEVEFTALLVDNLTVNGNVGLLDRKYKSFEIRDPVTDNLVDIAKSARFLYSPDTTANLGLEYRLPSLEVGRLTARVDYSYRSRMYWHASTFLNPYNDFISDGPVGRIDARLTWSDLKIGPAKVEVAIWGKNLTNEDYLLGGVDFGSLGFSTVGYAEPRTWGIDLRMGF